MDLNEKNPRNPQVDEVDGLNHNWNVINLKIPGVRVVQVNNAPVMNWQLKKRAIKACDMFVELWTPFKVFKEI